MVQCSRAQSVLAENMGLVPRTLKEAHNSL